MIEFESEFIEEDNYRENYFTLLLTVRHYIFYLHWISQQDAYFHFSCVYVLMQIFPWFYINTF
jgi:hypothetical protein